MMELHSSYRQATIFDQLWLALARGLRRPAWLQGRRAWGWSFGLLAGLFGVIGAAFLLDALAPAAGNSALASLGSALLSLGVFRHFARCALPLLQPHVTRHGVSRVRAEKGATRPVVVPGATRPAAGGPADSATPARPRSVSTLSAAERRAYLADLRCAGVNVSIARALVSAGYLSGAALAGASDAQILAVRGVGPATLKKIRACFRSAHQGPS